MKLNKWILVACLVLSVAMATGGTLAYLTDRESAANVLTFGDVNIELRDDFNQGVTMFPGVEVDKYVRIYNSGKNEAFVWATIAIPARLYDTGALYVNYENEEDVGQWYWAHDEQDPLGAYGGREYNFPERMWHEDEEYVVFTALHNAPLKPGEETSNIVNSLCLDHRVDITPDGEICVIEGGNPTHTDYYVNDVQTSVHVSVYAVQTEGFFKDENEVGEGYSPNKEAYWAYHDQWQGNGVEWGEQPTIFYVYNDADLHAALDQIYSNSDFWNRDVRINLADGEYSDNYTFFQYPTWNGIVGNGSSGNNMTSVTGKDAANVILSGQGNVRFTGNIEVKGNGYAGGDFENHHAFTDFSNIHFVNDWTGGENDIQVKLLAAASNVNFYGCTFENSSHITVGERGTTGDDKVGRVAFHGCDFSNGNNISGYVVEHLDIQNCTMAGGLKGFVNQQSSGAVTVNSVTVDCAEYAFRTTTGFDLNVSNSNFTLSEVDDKGTMRQDFIRIRGKNLNANIENCNVTFKDAKGNEKVFNYDGVTEADCTINGGVTVL